MRTILAACLILATALPAAAQDRPRSRPDVERCTDDGLTCIRLPSYTEDVCTAIETASVANGIDTAFFARLLWQESLFDAAAISPAGAQGIAQFMPGTADLRGLEDPFNPAEAIHASAAYLSDLIETFGNEGLAAAAYNSGEARTDDFVRFNRILPGETRNYVRRVTGHSAIDWRDAPPEDVDYALASDEPFQGACRRQAGSRNVQAFKPKVPPWGVVVAAGRRRPTVETFADRVRQENGEILAGRAIEIVDGAYPWTGLGKNLVARISSETQAEAVDLCRTLRTRRVFCRVVGPN